MKLAWATATSARFSTRSASTLARSSARTRACCDTLLVSTRESTPDRTRTTITSRMAAAAAIRVASDRRAASHRARPMPQPPRNRRRLPNDSTSLRMEISATTRRPSEASSAVRGHRTVTPRHPSARNTTAARRRVESQLPCSSRPPWMSAAAASSVAAADSTPRKSVPTPSRSDRSSSTSRRLAAARKTTRSAARETIEVEVLTRPSTPRRRYVQAWPPGAPMKGICAGAEKKATGGA